MDKTAKRELVAELEHEFSHAGAIVVAHYAGLTVADLSSLRRKASEVGSDVRVAKNKLAKIALSNLPQKVASDFLVGQTIFVYSSDPIAAPKVATEFAKDKSKFVVLGGAFYGQKLDVDGVQNLASLPSLDVLRGTLIGLLQAPATKLARVTQAPAAQLARVLSAYAEKNA